MLAPAEQKVEHGKDYVLYSAGLNGQDEKGRDYECDPSGDDVGIRTAPPQ